MTLQKHGRYTQWQFVKSNAIIEGLTAANVKLQQKVESSESRISNLKTDCNKQD